MATRKAICLVSGLFEEVNTPTDKLDFAGNSTTDLSEGTNLYFTNTRARSAISVTDNGGDGALSYDSATGVISYTGPSASEVRAHFSVATGSGLTYSSSTGEFGTSAIPNSQLANSSITVGSTSINLGGTATTVAGLTSLTSTTLVASTTLNIGAAGAANSIQIDSTGIIFEGSGADANETTFTAANPSADRTITLPDLTGTVALLNSLSVTESGTGFGSLSYDNSTGVFTFTKVTATDIRGQISVTDNGGDGALSYDNSTGVISYTGPSASEVRAHFSVATGSGLTYNSGTGEFGTSAIPNSQLANSSITVGSTGIALGSSATTITGLTSVTSNAVVTNDSGFRVRNTADNTKLLAFDVSGVTTSTTRTLTIPDSSGTIALLGVANAFTGANTFTNSTGQTFRQAATQDGFIIQGRGGGTSNFAVTFSTATLTANRTHTFPDLDGNVLLDTSPLPATFLDTNFRVQDNGDNTKQLAFECSGISTSTTRTLTVPNENGTIATQDFTTALAIALG